MQYIYMFMIILLEVFSPISWAASPASLTLYGDVKPLLREKNAGKSRESPKVATHTPCVSCSINQAEKFLARKTKPFHQRSHL